MSDAAPSRFRRWLAPPHPTWQSSSSRRRVEDFLREESNRVPKGRRVNVGSASKRFAVRTVNLDLLTGEQVDVQGDVLSLPFQDQTVDTVVCTGVLEHVADPHRAVAEFYRVMKPGGRIFVEAPFMQTVHASPGDYSRWTRDGLGRLMTGFEVQSCHVVAGPASALAWLVQETLAMLFSLRNELLYKLGLRLFGWLAVPLSWLDLMLERHPMAWHAASGFAVVAAKPGPKPGREEAVARP
ncbi:MAG: methyltransferase domain-containing protein [Nitrospirota bacterium]